MTILTRLGLIASALLVPSAAQACRAPPFVSAIVHSALPASLPDGLVAIEAEFPDSLNERDFHRNGGEARILRVIRGAVPGPAIWVDPRGAETSCDYAFSNGRKGLIVGRLMVDNGRTILDPIWVVHRNGFRMTDGRGKLD